MTAPITPQEAYATWLAYLRHHKYWYKPYASKADAFDLRTGPQPDPWRSEPSPQPWRLAADRILSLISLKEIVAGVQGAEQLKRLIDAEMDDLIDGTFLTPDPEGSEGSSFHSEGPAFNAPSSWHFPFRWIPDPLPWAILLAEALNATTKFTSDDEYRAEIKRIIGLVLKKGGISVVGEE